MLGVPTSEATCQTGRWRAGHVLGIVLVAVLVAAATPSRAADVPPRDIDPRMDAPTGASGADGVPAGRGAVGIEAPVTLGAVSGQIGEPTDDLLFDFTLQDARAYQLLARVLFRILAFDRQLVARCEFGAVRVVIVRGESERSAREAEALAHAFEQLRGTTIGGLPYEYQVSSGPPPGESYEVVFLPTGLKTEVVRQTLDHTRRHGILCLTTDLSYLRSGAAVAVVVGTAKPEIVIQKTRALEQGAQFDPRLYAYSMIICD